MAKRGERGSSSEWLVCLALVALSGGCAGQAAETDRQLATMNERLMVLQNDRDRLMERVDALESQKPNVVHEANDSTMASGAPTTRPRLKIVRLEPAPPPSNGELQAQGGGEDGDEPSLDSPEPRSAGDARSAGDEGMPANVASPQPKVVLYGEGAASGVRPSAEGAITR